MIRNFGVRLFVVPTSGTVIFDRSSRYYLPVHVRFGTKATDMPHCRETTLRADCGIMQRSERRLPE
jgi:hypothetical protein